MKNQRAIGFYERLGFNRIVVYEQWGWIGYGMKL
jgi:ribosomal protein S18 acetylase RimI-like enzyme